MKRLDSNWFTHGALDAEHKRYILLAYLQEVEKEYKLSKIYPALSDLDRIIREMLSFKTNCEQLESSFPKSVSSISLKERKLEFSSEHFNNELLHIIYEILDYSIPKVEEKIKMGQEIFNSVEKFIHIEPLGILPIYRDEGYLLFQNNSTTDVDIYNFKMYFLEEGKTSRVLKTEFIKRTTRSISNTFYSIKERLIKEMNHLPNPATFIVNSSIQLPYDATLLPVTKRLFMRKLVSNQF